MPERAEKDRSRRRAAGMTAAALVVAAAAIGPSAASAEPAAPVEMTPALRAQIQQLIDDFRDEWHLPGISAAVVTPDPHGTAPVITTFVAGTVSLGGAEPVEPTTRYELGSETKIVTADLLAAMVAAGTVSLDDPVQQFAPSGITVPTWTDPDTSEVVEITLGDLATHQAAFTDDPPNFDEGCAGDPACVNPHPGYTRTMLWDAFDGYVLPWEPGTQWLYSNWGFGLLGTILADLVEPGADPPAFQTAIERAFLDDLGMASTGLEDPADPRLAPPTLLDGQPAMFWDNTNALAGGGGLVSDARDMGVLVAAHLGFVDPSAPLGVRSMPVTLEPVSAITSMCTAVGSCEHAEFEMGLAWQLYRAAPAHVDGVHAPWAFKNGGTAGSSTDTALAPGLRVGVTTMFNMERDPEPYDGVATAILALLVDSVERELPPTGSEPGGLAGLGGWAAVLLLGGGLLVAGLLVAARRGPARPAAPARGRG